MREILRSVVDGLGCREKIAVATVERALEEFPEFRPDIILCDYHLEDGAAGLDFVRELRMSPDDEIAKTPIILITSFTEPAALREAVNAGVDEILAKPLSVKALCERLHAVMHNRRAFIRTEHYVGPDRRRHAAHIEFEDRRKADVIAPDPVPETETDATAPPKAASG